MSETIISQWYYDLIRNSYDAKLRHVRPIVKRDRKLAKRNKNGVVEVELFKEGPSEVNIADLAKFEERYVKITELKKRLLDYAMPIRVGPATIDSLINQDPSSFECIQKGKLPFDHIFFDLVEPFEGPYPFHREKSHIIGMQLERRHPLDIEGSNLEDYVLRIFYKDDPRNFNDFGGIDSVRIGFAANDTSKLWCTVSEWYKSSKVEIDMSSNTCILRPNKLHGEEDAIYNIDPEDKDIFRMYINLVTNLVNYINAHNVTVTRVKRDVDVEKKGNGKRRIIKREEDYCLIQIKDAHYRVAEPHREGWELQWRVYVRGHDRRYRDENGRIRRTIWIEPYVKGPINAPWREQRYQVLAEKLFREKEMSKMLEKNLQ